MTATLTTVPEPTQIFGAGDGPNKARLLLTMTEAEKQRLEAVAKLLGIPMSEVLKRGANLLAAKEKARIQPKNG